MIRIVTALLAIALSAAVADGAAAAEHYDLPIRGRSLSLTLYRPPRGVPSQGTIIMASGDVGWVGLAVSMAEHLSASGFTVVGVNVRQYLSAFTSAQSHLTPPDVMTDWRAIARDLEGRGVASRSVIVSGVSEGAALAVLAAASPDNHEWIAGVITMGLPASAEIAWRWSDFTSWITKKDVSEPSFAPRDFLAAIAPLPIVMIQSTRDEYVPAADYRDLLASAHPPKKQVLIDASNHRFTDRIPELRRAYEAALIWLRAPVME